MCAIKRSSCDLIHRVTVQLYREQVADLTEKLSREQNTRYVNF